MPRKSAAPALEPTDDPDALRTAPCVPALRRAVGAWREEGYPGITETSRILLNHWFRTDYRLPTGVRFAYHASQREAIETLIYLYEVARARTRKDLLERYARIGVDLRLAAYDEFARYCVKMATGAGKTKVMSLAVVWHYLNAMREESEDYARTFLIIAPNVIVLERLKTDFAGGRIFKADPLIPRSLEIFWDFDCVMRDEGERAFTEGLLFLTNVQQLYEKKEKAPEEPQAMLDVLGPRPPAGLTQPPTFAERIGARAGNLLVINDEAHHTHDENSEWNGVIRSLHEYTPLAAQLDFSATPRYQKGGLFAWTVSDYPLKQAILDGVVKRPLKGIANIQEVHSEIASVRYEGFITAAVERWRAYRDLLKPVGKKPLLFVMLNSTGEADDVADYLRSKYPGDLGGEQTLVIHTDRSGEISKKDLDLARRLAREVDDERSPVNALVSVLMLREGWDVQNVTVVLGLRPYTSKANILPEQTIGRGLRLMFRNAGTGYVERVDVIGNKTFLDFVEDLERIEDLDLETFEVGKDKLSIFTIAPQAEKAAYDIAVPTLSPLLLRKRSLTGEIAALDVRSLNAPTLPLKPGDAAERTFRYEGYDLLTLEKMVEDNYTIPEPRTAGELIGYYARRIAESLKLPSQFAALAPKVRDFFAYKAFGQPVDLDDQAVIRAMNRNAVAYVTIKAFGEALRPLLVERQQPSLQGPPRMLSATPPFPFSRPTIYEAAKCIFNLVPCENEFERTFARFLQGAPDVQAFAKLPDQFGFSIEYTDTAANLRLYYPDFVARLEGGEQWLLETKGQENIDVARKDAAAELWCENATLLSGLPWRYLKVPQKAFVALQAADFSDLMVLGG
jgi:type III restriction enzyme